MLLASIVRSASCSIRGRTAVLTPDLLFLLVPSTVLELGSGAGLPSLIAASMIPAPASVLLTDYPDPAVTSNLAANVQRNLAAAGGRCMLAWKGYAWGEVVRELL
jgi:methylase of polypeptide subunit release factors